MRVRQINQEMRTLVLESKAGNSISSNSSSILIPRNLVSSIKLIIKNESLSSSVCLLECIYYFDRDRLGSFMNAVIKLI